MKHFIAYSILLIIIVAIAITPSSCSNNDENYETRINQLSTLNEDIDNVFSIEKDGVVMSFSLLNSQGDTTVAFSEREDIIFDLQIKNTTDEHISIPGGPMTLGYNTFRVYTAGGEDCGVSWHYVQNWTKEMPYLWPNKTYHYQCPWYSDEVIKTTYPFIFQTSHKQLVKGYYYTEAYCYINNGTTLYCKIHFNIK